MKRERHFKRTHLVYYLRVFDGNTNELLGHLVDITPEGIMLISDKAIETNMVLQLKMLLPTETSARKYLNFVAKSQWCKKDVNSDFFDTGFQFLEITEQGKEIILDLVEDIGLND